APLIPYAEHDRRLAFHEFWHARHFTQILSGLRPKSPVGRFRLSYAGAELLPLQVVARLESLRKSFATMTRRRSLISRYRLRFSALRQ
ncbi:MAG: hypothetical protein WAL86_16590, partial [Candidatus Acidiferrales bacterium]